MTLKNLSGRPDNPSTILGSKGEVAIFRAGTGRPGLEVRLEQGTLWLNINQLAALFERDKSVISRHLRNVYREGELAREATVAFFATVQEEGGRQVSRQIEFYNLDAILSVGYRVNSARGTQFRIWATGVLHDHIVRGYSVNARRLKELRQSLRIAGQVLDTRAVTADEASALLRVVADYAAALDLLDDYDHQRVRPPRGSAATAEGISYEEAQRAIAQLRETYGESSLFGQEKDGSLQSSLAAAMQSFGGQDLYPTLEEKAANLLYFLVKNHSFVDGNKRIAAALFLWFMEKNNILFSTGMMRRIADNALVAITLMIAESKPAEKYTLCHLVAHLIGDPDL